MEMAKTNRGFILGEFVDRNGVSCSIQESSIASENAIWLGCNDIGLVKFEPDGGWKDIPLENDPEKGISYIANTRMHLTQDMVKELLPKLKYFAETGRLPEND